MRLLRVVCLSILLLAGAMTTTAPAQTEGWEEASAALRRAIDLHVHTAPDSGPRSLDAFDLARIARRHGMRALLYKNHHTQTASLAYLVSQAVDGVEAYGGIALNRSVGGINPIAVEKMALTTGRLGRVVWMPTRDAEHAAKMLAPNPHVVPISRDGQLLPEVLEVLAVMARFDLALATGHSSPAESLLLIREAKAAGIDRIIVTHPMHGLVGMTLDVQQQAAAMGAYIEYCVTQLLPADTGKIKPEGGFPIEELAKMIRAVGTDRTILTTDLGQELNPIHTDGLILFLMMLRDQGFTEQEIDRMSKVNPAQFLALP